MRNSCLLLNFANLPTTHKHDLKFLSPSLLVVISMSFIKRGVERRGKNDEKLTIFTFFFSNLKSAIKIFSLLQDNYYLMNILSSS